MTYKEFVASRKKPGQDLMDSWDVDKASAVHMLVGLADEWMEFMGADSAENAQEELGDLIFYMEGLLQDFGLTLESSIYPDFHTESFMEVYTAVKRHLMYNKPIDLDQLEVSATETIQHALAHLCVEWEVKSDFEQLKEANVAKLTKRYESGYSDKAAQERADKEEG